MSDDVPLTMGREPDESTLIRYLVGQASEEETEQLDELSVTSEEFAVRLRAVEHDLVDAYIQGELTGGTLEGFRAQYLRTPAGLEAVDFAKALRGYRRVPAMPAAAAAGSVAPMARATTSPWPKWLLAAAAVALVASAVLLMENVRLRREISGVRETQASLEERTRQLQEALNQQQTAARAVDEELVRAREHAGGGSLPLLALVLSPATRGGDQLAQFSVPPGADSVILRLPLIAVEFAQYEAVLRDAAGDRVFWRSGRLLAPPASSAPPARERPMIPVTVPTNLLTPRAYMLELTGISARGDAEPLDSYPFRVVP